jgi:hypothetical protein
VADEGLLAGERVPFLRIHACEGIYDLDALQAPRVQCTQRPAEDTK